MRFLNVRRDYESLFVFDFWVMFFLLLNVIFIYFLVYLLYVVIKVYRLKWFWFFVKGYEYMLVNLLSGLL